MAASGNREVWWREARRNGLEGALLTCFVLLLSYGAAELGGMLEMRVPQPVWLLWPGCAVLSTILFLQPKRAWPVLLAAGLAGFVLYDIRAGLTISTIAWLLLTDACEILIATLGARSLFKENPYLDLGSISGFTKYCVFAVFLAPLVAATIGAYGPGATYWMRWQLIFLSEAVAFLTIPPAILGWVSQSEKQLVRWVEAAILMSGVTLLGYVISVASGPHIAPALFYALVPFLIWSALRFGPLGVSSSILVVAFLSIWGTIQGKGPFTAERPVQNALSLQLFLLCAATPFMVLAVLANQHKRIERALRALSGRLINAQEDERKRIARELHDDLSQRMARLLIRLERWRQGIGEMSEKSLAQFNAIVAMASEVSASLRDLSHLLHPGTLATLGLVPSLEGLCRRFSEQEGLDVKFVYEDIPVDTPANVKLCVFRIVQESLRNVVTHSGAKEVRVTLNSTASGINVCVQDSGTGFRLGSVRKLGALGLISMRERAHLIGAQLSIKSEPGEGTRVSLQIPLKQATLQATLAEN